ncbi:nuclease-related domain-containing protein [[Kitasatospora] papulosa]|uniref:nuclease-related domain-containing protein n=1 Tax=[Kitasatospora] papulosa TaxID=1464011 RepID=UPI003682C426
MLWLCGVRTPGMRRADAVADRWKRGAAGEAATARLLAPLSRAGWHVRHDLQLRGRRFNVDHVLVSPCGTAVVVADTKSWHRGQPTVLVDGRVHCGDPRRGRGDDRHDQVEAVARYARLVEAALNLPGVAVVPLIVVHGSPVAPGGLEAPVLGGTVWVLGAGEVVRRLREAVQTLPNRHRAQALDARVKAVLSPYR